MEDSRDSTPAPSSSWSHFLKRRRAKNVVDDHGNVYYDNKTNTYYNVDKLASTNDYGEDTAPFDVAAFLDYLAACDYGTCPEYCQHTDDDASKYSNVRTHYYGDDCPGGHYND